MTRLEERCPRLARAHAAELAYQQRKAAQRRVGVVTMDVAIEEMARGLRAFARAYGKRRSSPQPVYAPGIVRDIAKASGVPERYLVSRSPDDVG